MFFLISKKRNNDRIELVRDKMIDYIILEEDLRYLKKYSKVIEQVMMNYDLEYQTTVISDFNSINKRFFHKINSSNYC